MDRRLANRPLAIMMLRQHLPSPQVLAADWCKYNDCVIATGSVDKSIKTWDKRMPQRELAVLLGHTYAVRRCAPIMLVLYQASCLRA